MQMHLSSEPHIPDGMLAAIALRNEKPRLGVPSRNPALHQGINACNSTIVLGLQSTAALNRVGSRCTGKERDAESGNDYFGARYYGSTQGRFFSPDPSGLTFADPTNPQSLNLYSYVRNNPLTSVDPNGLTDCTGTQATGASTVNDPSSPPPPNCATDPSDIKIPTIKVYVNLFTDNANIALLNPGNQVDRSRPQAPSKVGCNTVLPNGKTLGQYINQGRAQMQASVNAGGSLNGEVLTTFASIAMDYGQIDFKNGAGGNSVLANRAQLGQAGNFAYYAIGSGYLSPTMLDTGASAYSVFSGKPFSTLHNGHMLIDRSAASVRTQGLATPGCPS
jgi:RHS repeat-associated protein